MDAAALDALLGSSAQEREESWRYSRNALRALAQQAFAEADPATSVSTDIRARFAWPESGGRRLVFVNGGWSAELSDTHALGDTVRLDVDAAHITLTIRGGTEHPVHLVHLGIAAGSSAQWQATCDIVVESGAATIFEHHLGAAGAEVLGALVSRHCVAADATLSVATLSDLPDSISLYRRVRAVVRKHAQYRTTHALFGGRFVRLDLDCELADTAARTDSRGVFALRGRQHTDVHLDVRHAARDTASDVLWRGVADQRARGILHGAITVAEGADGADAQLQTKNLLLSANAEIDAQPVLEIYADEVKASHGATVGQLDERALFYLRSRGVPRAIARSLLIAGFCREAYQGEDASLAARLDALLAERLPGAAA
ncbi:MAG TPA: SufD family Fe-S cluster assembly protein [Rudaea sp.]|nr:SufD family Fe-S cluster assembly protein [Rudaea sp.]